MTMKLAQIALSGLVGAGLATLAFTATPLRAQSQIGWWPMGQSMHGVRWQGGQPMGPGMGGMPCNGGVFDPTTLETLQGTATAVNRYGGHQGTFVTLQTAQETLEVHLGPAWYLQNQGFELADNSPMAVTGWRSNWHGQSMLMASEVKQGDRTLQLRDANGYPLWMQQEAPSR
ncbi:MAG: hypothetical protein DCF32_22370 [Leptolyngbya sp.]|nr:MAG: hypothetical protein DCF32_22370 [Leptolyngbya sp.]